MKKAILLIFFLFCIDCFAKLNIDSFYVSLKSNEVNLRIGPGNEYPIRYIYQLKDLPLKVIGEYDNWYKVVDKEGEEGWINKNLTSKKRTLIVVNGTQLIYKKNTQKSSPIYRVEENVILKYIKCEDNWCKVDINDKVGWILASGVWGY